MVTLSLIVVLTCFIAGHCLILREKTPSVVRVREGDTLTLEAEVDSHELNLRFTGPGNRPLGYGYADHRARDGYEVLNVTDTGYLFSVWLTIEHVDRFQSGRYFLTGYDAYSWERRDWTVVVQVEPLRHVSSVTFPPTCDVNADVADLGCGGDTAGHVYWEYIGCNVTIRDADDIISEFDQCEGLHEADDGDKIELLHVAAKHGDEQLVAKLLMLGTDVKNKYYRDVEGIPLCMSARLGHVQVVHLLLNAGAPLTYGNFLRRASHPTIETYPVQNVSAVDCAAWSGSPLLVDTMLAREAELGATNVPVDREGGSPILYAALSGSVNLVKQFLSRGEFWNYSDGQDRTPLFFASLSGSVQLVQFLRDVGADLFAKDSNGRSILFYAARSGSVELVEYLVSAGLRALEEDSNGVHPIVEAVLGGSEPVLESFLKRGCNAFYIDRWERSLLHFAAIAGHVTMVERLALLGLDVNATEKRWRFTPLHYAAMFHNNPLLIQTIISLGGDIEARDEDGNTPLHLAALRAHPSSVEQLLKSNANVSAVNRDGDTALHTAGEDTPGFIVIEGIAGKAQGGVPLYMTRSSRFRRVIRLLLDAGADPNAVNSEGQTPPQNHWTHGIFPCEMEVIEMFVKAGWNANAVSRIRRFPMFIHNYLSCVGKLVKVGVIAHFFNYTGDIPLDIEQGWG